MRCVTCCVFSYRKRHLTWEFNNCFHKANNFTKEIVQMKYCMTIYSEYIRSSSDLNNQNQNRHRELVKNTTLLWLKYYSTIWFDNQVKNVIPVKDFTQRNLVSVLLHLGTIVQCGNSLSGQFVWTLTVADEVTGWTENRAISGESGHIVTCGFMSGFLGTPLQTSYAKYR